MKFVQGDLISLFKQGEFDMIAHQCNCMGVFGAGIAKVLAEEFPQIDVEVNGVGQAISLFGTYEYFSTEYGYIINMYSQFNVGKCSEVGIDSFEVRLGALENCLHNINEDFSGQHIGLPLIASGLAKKKSHLNDLDYFNTFILPSVNKCLRDMKVTIVYL